MFKPLEIVLSSTMTFNSWSVPAPQKFVLDNDYSIEAYHYMKDKIPKTDEQKLLDIMFECIIKENQ